MIRRKIVRRVIKPGQQVPRGQVVYAEPCAGGLEVYLLRRAVR